MLNKNNTNLGIIFLQNLMEFFGYSDHLDNESFHIGIKKAIDLYKYMHTLYLTSMQKMELEECKQIIIELETILNKITKLIDAIKADADPDLIEDIRNERNTLMKTKTKLFQDELETINKKGDKK
ncbi:hypothetical protein baBA2_000976 (plasmid) [Borrelia anserina]|uniref:Borrelia hemolysin B-type protein n=2 Tax=Borrelia anserina TaxID=143 RepID=A0ABM6FVJ4_BORAN|nr:BlyB family putative holin accessory protein [Borrelia anserina]AHH08953.1 Putative cytosolic protein [Borrelia anserina BA2]APR65382.1 Borrelia hemolysin B-type protein [Borrelia anserina Es]UPA07345.1 hypothetical protein baBA2_000976 [Borrelia anserina]